MKYIIVGAVAGGASAAARLRRLDEQADIIIFEKGAYISYANCGLPYYIGNVIRDRNKLFVQTAAAFNLRFNIDVRVTTEVIDIDTANKTITAKNLQSGEIYKERYDKLVLSPGAEPLRPPLPGINMEGIFTLRNVADTDYIKQYIDQRRSGRAVIIGAGFIGLEMAENLHDLGMKVSVVEMGKQVMAPLDYPMAAIVQQHIRSRGVELLLNTSVTGFERSGDHIGILLNSGEQIEADVVILSIGVRPDTKLAVGAGLKIGAAKGIEVNEFLQTSDPDIYAVGDAIEFINPLTHRSMITYLAGPANKQGRICADNIVLGNTHKYRGSINTAIVKIFEMTVGSTGVASKHLQAAGIDHMVSITHNGAHAGYYPGAEYMTIQITFSPEDGHLLGAQVVGYDGADKRLDVLASLIQQGCTVYDLAAFEHAYAPPYSSAKDPVNMSGFVAENMLDRLSAVFHCHQVAEIGEDDMLIDVRTADEYSKGKIGNAINIPVDELRYRRSEIPKDRKIYLYCEVGARGYLAQRILMQNGYDRTFNLSGGYKLWSNCAVESGILDKIEKSIAV